MSAAFQVPCQCLSYNEESRTLRPDLGGAYGLLEEGRVPQFGFLCFPEGMQDQHLSIYVAT